MKNTFHVLLINEVGKLHKGDNCINMQSESRIMNNLDRIFLKNIIVHYVWLQSIKYPICFHIYEASNWECRCLYCCLLENTVLDVCCYIEVCSEQGISLFRFDVNVMNVIAVII